jgi:hypothetical protein
MFSFTEGRLLLPQHVDVVAPFTALGAVGIQSAASEESRIVHYISYQERRACGTPAKLALALTPEEIATVSALRCFSPDFSGFGHFKELLFTLSLTSSFEHFKELLFGSRKRLVID